MARTEKETKKERKPHTQKRDYAANEAWKKRKREGRPKQQWVNGRWEKC